ncbi:hypothetical protein ACFQ3S_19635 [Mucilaginibacter terrae]|uniref:hypothetical protein n=1 Tax=Mucilaginibacter terrae TaxID=1955052 RepID=UPI0036280F60
MTRYKNQHGNSGVLAYEIGEDSIAIQFVRGDSYLYTYRKPGKTQVDQMKVLAAQGEGLSTYISRVVKGRYEEKL